MLICVQKFSYVTRNALTAQSPLNLAQTFSLPTEDLDLFAHFLPKIVKIKI